MAATGIEPIPNSQATALKNGAEDRLPMLFKYQAVTAHTLASLSQQRLHFSSPRHYNDPYDSRTQDTSDLTDERVRQDFIAWLKSSRRRTPHTEDSTGENADGSINESDEFDVAKVLEFERAAVLEQVRVCCFSELENDMTLWSHYGDQHKGICLGFDRGAKPFRSARRVEYVDDIPGFNFIEGFSKNDFGGLVDAYHKKYRGWEREYEWRIVELSDTDPESYYGSESLRVVYLGTRIEAELADLVLAILAEYPDRDQLEVYQLRPNPSTYQFDQSKRRLYGTIDAYADDMVVLDSDL